MTSADCVGQTCYVAVVQTGGKSVRLAAEFTDFVLQIGSWKTQFSLSAIRPQGWVQTTYLVSGAVARQDGVIRALVGRPCFCQATLANDNNN